ncbi:3-oxoacyl-reductase [Hypoxylon trugodes]|uniref:3-oxoacyl-reductase n=1 Tax=Hypoxylon trugodes TaxID=326681 RepID=UPI00218FF75E|nr:3-oxoacyl-reductase [Hypoxylon trugodes]KAI1391300.1 3-oxoacyl-reductase [Hypoxylon trugodes]
MIMTSLDGKVFAITGGASGIGLATTQILSKHGGIVCIADIDPVALEKAEKYFAHLNTPFTVTKVDISKREEVESWIDSIVQKYGRLDGAANVAGIIGKHHGVREIADLDDDEWHKIIAVNLTGTMYCLRAELRKIVDGGSIVNVSSIHGLQGFAKHGAYDASKHGVIGLTKAAAKENGAREVRVNAVAPGAIFTPLMEKSWKIHERPPNAPYDDTAAFRRQGTAEECANVIAFLLGPDSKYVSGSVYSVDGAM